MPERSGVPDLTALASPLKQALVRGCACRSQPRDTRHSGAGVDHILAEHHDEGVIFIVEVYLLRQVLLEVALELAVTLFALEQAEPTEDASGVGIHHEV